MPASGAVEVGGEPTRSVTVTAATVERSRRWDAATTGGTWTHRSRHMDAFTRKRISLVS